MKRSQILSQRVSNQHDAEGRHKSNKVSLLLCHHLMYVCLKQKQRSLDDWDLKEQLYGLFELFFMRHRCSAEFCYFQRITHLATSAIFCIKAAAICTAFAAAPLRMLSAVV